MIDLGSLAGLHELHAYCLLCNARLKSLSQGRSVFSTRLEKSVTAHRPIWLPQVTNEFTLILVMSTAESFSKHRCQDLGSSGVPSRTHAVAGGRAMAHDHLGSGGMSGFL